MARVISPSSCAKHDDSHPRPVRRRALRRLVGDELDAADQADAAHLADQRVLGEARAAPAAARPDLRRVLDELRSR